MRDTIPHHNLFDRVLVEPRRQPARSETDREDDDRQDQRGRVASLSHFGIGGTQLEEDRGITFTFNGDKEPPTEITIRLDGQDGATNLLFQVTLLDSIEDVDSFMTFLEGIWGHVLDNLKAVLERSV